MAAAALSLGVVGSMAATTPADGTGARPTDAATGTVAGLDARLAEVRARLDDQYAAADRAILEYTASADRLEDAKRTHRATAKAATRAVERHAESRRTATTYAVSAYTGSGMGTAAALVEPDGPQELRDRGADLELLAGHQQEVLDRTGASKVAKEALRERAATAEEEREEATESAASAKEEAIDAVADQRGALREILGEQSGLERRLADARGDGDRPERERADALRRARAAASPAGQGRARSGGECTRRAGKGGHANGRVPESELCPLPQGGERLRAGAAAAFLELDGAFRKRFGRPICVTDSYRPLDEQVRLFREKEAGKAATPGSSTHGLGTAVDLCGGINEETAPEHAWMRSHAPQHGWHLPQWARNGFEPWHWEYKG